MILLIWNGSVCCPLFAIIAGVTHFGICLEYEAKLWLIEERYAPVAQLK
jgi:hypothetical protein